jgi:hypothetical protein
MLLILPPKLSDLFDVMGRHARGLEVLLSDAVKDFFPQHHDVIRRFNAQADLLAPDFHHGDADVVTHIQAFSGFSGQNEHGQPSWQPVFFPTDIPTN